MAVYEKAGAGEIGYGEVLSPGPVLFTLEAY